MVIDNFFIRNLNFDTIPIDEEWSLPKRREDRIHTIHAYPAKFPAFITSKAIEKCEGLQIHVESISDIFCGCGTVAYESVSNGIDFWGYDINPVATLIARTKSREYNHDALVETFKEIKENFKVGELNKNYNFLINDRIKYWFFPEQIEKLSILRDAIFQSVKNDIEKDFFLCAFSNILKSCSRWLTKSIKPQLDPNKVPKDVRLAFETQVNLMIKAVSEIEGIKGKSHIKTQNILLEEITEPFIDLLVTSPPYVTSYEYADLHQLSTLWLGLAEDYRVFREGSIGSLHGSEEFEKNRDKLNQTGKEVVDALFSRDKGKAKSVAQYYVDMQLASTKVGKMLKDNGAACFVIGNTSYKGIHMDNAKHLSESLFEVGFVDQEIARRKISYKILTPYRDEKGKFSKDAKGSRKVYSEEFVIFAKKK